MRIQDQDFGERVAVAGRLLLAPFRFLVWLGRVCFRTGWFFVFRLPVTITGALFLAIGALVIVSIVHSVYGYNHDPSVRLRAMEVFVVSLRQADERHDRELRMHGLPPVRPENRSAAAVESQIADLKAQMAKQGGAGGAL